MREAERHGRSPANPYERLDAVSMGERARLHAKAQRARAEYVAELTDRAVNALGRLMRVWIVQPLGRWFGKPVRVEEGYDRP